MTAEEIVDLAEQLGLHCDYEDCPEENDAETLLVWHDSDDSTVGGVFIQIHEGQAQLADLKSWARTGGDAIPMIPDKDGGAHVPRCIRDYAERSKNRTRIGRKQAEAKRNKP